MVILAGLLLLVISPFLWSQLTRGEPLAFVLPVMIVYNVVSIEYAGTQSSGMQWFLLFLAIFAMLLGRLMLHKRKYEQVAFHPVLRLQLVLVLLVVGGVVSLVLFALHGVPVFAENTQTARVLIFENGYLGTLAVVPLQVAFVGSSIALISRASPTNRSRTLAFTTIVVSCVFLALYGNRGLIVFPALTVLSFFLLKKPKSLLWLTPLSSISLLVISYAGYARNLEAWGPAYLNDLARLGFEGPLRLMAPVFGYLTGTSVASDIVLQRIPQDTSFPGGAVFFSAFISPLPGKQLTPGEFLKELAGYDFDGFGLAMGGAAGFYMDFGVLGVFVGYVCLGALFGFLRNRAAADSRYTVMLAYLAGHLLLMNFSHPLPNLAMVLIPIVLFFTMKPPSADGFTVRGGGSSAAGIILELKSSVRAVSSSVKGSH